MPAILKRAPSGHKKTLPQWTLSDLLANPEKDFVTIIKQMERHTKSFETQRKSLRSGISPQGFLKALKTSETLTSLASRLAAFSQLWFAENTKNQSARSLEAKVREELTRLGNRTLFFDLWWQQLDTRNANRLLAHSGDFRYYLESLRRLKNHTLTEPEERIVNLKNTTGRGALDSLYDVLTNGLSFSLRIKGQTKKLNREQLSSYVRHPSSSVRKSAYQELLRVYGSQSDVLGEIYKSLVLDSKNEGELRKYPSPVSIRNIQNDIPDAVVSTLLQCCRKNRHIFQEYFRIKGKLCRVRKMTRYDIYAPQPGERSSYPFSQAKQLVFNAYQQFSPTLAGLAQRVLDEQHLDAQPRNGKMGGAFCYSVHPQRTPYVLLNYTGDARDIATLAHELGHAVHSMLAKDHSIFTFHATLPLAETASVFGEQLLSQALLQDAPNPRTKQRLLLGQLDDLYATIMRQAYFVEFENQAHSMIGQGATLNAIAHTYRNLLDEQFGKSVPVSSEFQWEWLTIPHIYRSPFYCYAYSFGNLLVLALYQQYQQEGPSFIPKYLNLLAQGGSKSPGAMLKPLGVDMTSEKFWQGGFDYITRMVRELERTL